MKIELSGNEIEQILDALSIAKNKYSCFKEIYDNFLQKIPKAIERSTNTPTVKNENSKNIVDRYIIRNKHNGAYLHNWAWPAFCCGYTLLSDNDSEQFWWTYSKRDAYIFRIREEAKQFADAISIKYNINRADIEVIRVGQQIEGED